MIPIIAIVGAPGSGSSILTCRLIDGLTKRGYRVAAVTRAAPKPTAQDDESDAARFGLAGACEVVTSAPKATPLAEIAAQLVDADLLLADGYDAAAVPKIEVWCEAQEDPRLLCAGDPNWVALVSDFPHDVEVPVLDLNWPRQATDFVEKRFLRRRPEPVKRAARR